MSRQKHRDKIYIIQLFKENCGTIESYWNISKVCIELQWISSWRKKMICENIQRCLNLILLIFLNTGIIRAPFYKKYKVKPCADRSQCAEHEGIKYFEFE